MKKLTKVVTVVLVVATICTGILPLQTSAETGITPRFINTYDCNCRFLAADGEAMANVSYNAKNNVFSHATITIKIQKRFLGVFWSTIAEWRQTRYEVNGTYYNSTPLEDTGTYRAVFTVEIYGIDGSVDTIEDKITSTYE